MGLGDHKGLTGVMRLVEYIMARRHLKKNFFIFYSFSFLLLSTRARTHTHTQTQTLVLKKSYVKKIEENEGKGLTDGCHKARVTGVLLGTKGHHTSVEANVCFLEGRNDNCLRRARQDTIVESPGVSEGRQDWTDVTSDVQLTAERNRSR